MVSYQNDESRPLIKKKKENASTKWYQKMANWPLKIIVLCFLLVVAVYLFYYVFIDKNIQSKADNDKYKPVTRNSLHVLSLATTNNEYLNQCAPEVKCDSYAKYRSINGSCNNLEIPTWGASKTPFLRMLNANYSDGFNKIRVQADGIQLPSVRLINVELFLSREVYRVDENNVLLMPFGQLLAHDISGLQTDLLRNDQGDVLFCCDDEYITKVYHQCQVSAEIPSDDPVYSKLGHTCLSIDSMITSRNYSCPLHHTTFIDANTHFIDASEVYGSTEDDMLRLRVMEGGRLNFSIADDGQMFCPFKQNAPKIVGVLEDSKVQYDTGDSNNGNQNLGIATMQNLFLRFHNYIAFLLSSINPFWSDEIIYQESRRIVIGTIQRITYKDFLPIIIGSDFHELYGLNDENIYDPNVNPSMTIEMSSAAYRVLHSIIPVQFNFMKNDYNIEFAVNITDVMQKSDLIPIDNHFEKLLKGFLETPGRVPQPSYNFDVSNFMFKNVFNNKPNYTGTDLMSTDIARGRDVGLQPYNQYRKLCWLPLANDFEDLVDLIHIKDIDKLKTLYKSVNDIDLLVGMMLEKLSDDALVGPTARCIIADGFYRFKAGDRYFYDVQGQPGSFTPDQLKVIQKITLGHVLCAVSNIDHVQQDMFKVVDHKLFPTSKLKCDEQFIIDLNAWKEYPNF